MGKSWSEPNESVDVRGIKNSFGRKQVCVSVMVDWMECLSEIHGTPERSEMFEIYLKSME